MGASGRGASRKKPTVEEAQQLSISLLHQHGVFAVPWGAWRLSWCHDDSRPASLSVSTGDAPSDQPGVRLRYTLTDSWTNDRTELNYAVGLTTTPCHLGGLRRWFLCPGSDCGRRVAKLYRPLSETHYLCRHCHHLTYIGRQQHRKGAYESFGRFGAYRRRLEEARTLRQKARWSLRLYEADERIKAYNKAYDERFWKRLDRLKRMDGSKIMR